jgi:two-component system chemotaxis sensor kinase CheA
MVAPLPRHMPRRTTGSGREALVDLDEEVREFLIECNENLANLDREVVLLEQNPTDAKLIASVFRTFHTIKGTCGFFGFTILGGVTHIAENILDQVRSNQRELTPSLTSLILQTVDAIKSLLAEVETNGNEGTNEYQELRNRLTEAFQYADAAAAEVTPETELKLETQSAPHPGTTPQSPKLKSESEPKPKSKAKPKKALERAAGGVEAAPAAVVPAAPASAPVAPGVPAATILQPAQPAQAAAAASQAKAAENAAAGSEEGAHKNTALGDSTIRVDVGLLDKLMNLVGELVLARNQLLQGTSGHDGVLIRTVQRLNVITSELQEGVLKTRMQPIGVVWNKLPRVIRDLASECGKKIQIEMEGAETELDKTIIEAIKDPLTHIVRNSCDHGVEMPEVRVAKGKPAEGSVILRAYHEGGHVNIEISDDGGGLDPEKLKARALQKGLIRADQAAAMTEREAVHLVFLPGFSTAEQITKISGRGVGMDVVKTNIQKIGGIVDIYNRPTSGSTVKIKIPLTLAIIPGLIINARRAETPGQDAQEAQEEHRFVIPQANLLELVRLERDADFKQIEYVNGTPVYRRRGQLLPLTYLNRVLGMATAVFPNSDVVNIVVLQAEDRPFGLVVDGIFDTQEIVVKPLGKRLKGLSSYLGATIMGDGRVALILDVQGLARLAGIVSQARDNRKHDNGPGDGVTEKQQAFLVFQAGRFQRLAVPLALVARLEQFPRRDIEFASGRPVLHYRGQILPLLALGHLLDASTPDLSTETGASGSMQVIVFDDGTRRVGVVVDQIVDIIEETVTFSQSSSHPGLLGSAIVGGTITDLIDLNTLLRAVTQGSVDADKKAAARLLIVDTSPIERTMLRGYLEMCGFHVTQACSFEESLELLPRLPLPDLVITAAKLREHTASELLQALRGLRGCAHLPVMALAAEETAAGLAAGSGAGPLFDAVAAPEDRAEVLRTIRAVLSRGRAQPHAAVAGQEPHHA